MNKKNFNKVSHAEKILCVLKVLLHESQVTKDENAYVPYLAAIVTFIELSVPEKQKKHEFDKILQSLQATCQMILFEKLEGE